MAKAIKKHIFKNLFDYNLIILLLTFHHSHALLKFCENSFGLKIIDQNEKVSVKR